MFPTENDRMFRIQQMCWTNPKDDRLQRVLQVCCGIHEVNKAYLSPQERLIVWLAAEYMRERLIQRACDGNQ
jgi:hypothetical protein